MVLLTGVILNNCAAMPEHNAFLVQSRRGSVWLCIFTAIA